jgi:glutamyl-tRNA synthetase
MTVVTRFAPSPTGFLHIGGARTALFNWLFAKHHGGKFLLRIEDTDRARSTDEAVTAILKGLKWLGLDWDGEAISQFARRERHAEVAHELLAKGQAYYCYCSQEELAAMREEARKTGRAKLYDGRWRDRDPSEAPKDVKPVIRLRAPLDGETVIEDAVQGPVRVANEQLDDMVLLRADGTATYMLAVVVDDHDMSVTHVIRGDDHLTNAFRQYHLYKAMGWDVPLFAHIPLIHGPDGAKMSKRHGALGVEAYRDMGYLPEALRNYLMRLSWAHGDDEIISTEQAIEWFGLDGVGRSAARFDFVKLENLNGHYIRQADSPRLAQLVLPILQKKLDGDLAADAANRIERGMPGLKERAKTLVELAEKSEFYVRPRPLPIDDKAQKLLDGPGRDLLGRFRSDLAGADPWDKATLEGFARVFSEQTGAGLGKIAQPLRAALTGSAVSPGIFEVMEVLGKDESLGRLDDVLGAPKAG